MTQGSTAAPPCIAAVRLDRVVEALPADFETMRSEALAEGYRFLERLATDWASGALRFTNPGEMLLAASSDGVLAGIGGVTVDPAFPDALRMRRFYIRRAFRQSGIGQRLAAAFLGQALARASSDGKRGPRKRRVLGVAGVPPGRVRRPHAPARRLSRIDKIVSLITFN